jgi:DNA invertase Pin-like site-specific DNA recombinase
MAKIGYIRVSSASQNSERQLSEVEVDKIFEDRKSGKSLSRPGLAQCLSYVREGDVLYVHSIDRLARSLLDLQNLVEKFMERGVTVKFVKEGLEFSADRSQQPMQKMVFQIMGAFAEFERNLIRERQQEGIEKALKKGKPFGRPRRCSDEQDREILKRIQHGEQPLSIAKEMNLSTSYIYKLCKRIGGPEQ